MNNHDSQTTLQSVSPAAPANEIAEELALTVVFHPDTSRIGQAAVVPGAAEGWVLGRGSPDFRGRGLAEAPLNDPYISRRALRLRRIGQTVAIERFESASRARVGNEELLAAMTLDREQLRRGVPLLLGHSVVLLLRLCRPVEGHPATPDTQLRGDSAAMRSLRQQIARAAASGADVLIRGETGSGKELVAAAIHAASDRACKPMISVNMAAIPADLAPAALFGSRRGAFTGADKAMPGYFREACGGTLFLDEIGDAPASVQPQLLRALQEREIQAVGGPVETVDVRVISATDQALDDEDSGFRAALRYRLAACEICVPPLREHPEDIGDLLYQFLAQAAAASKRHGLLPSSDTSPATVAAWAKLFHRFLCYRWPGNVRELANFSRQVVLSSDARPVLNEGLQSVLKPADRQRPATGARQRQRMGDITEEAFARAMRDNNYEVKGVALQLGVSRAAVYRRIEGSPQYRLANDIPADELTRCLAAAGGDCAAAAAALEVSVTSLRVRLRARAS